MEHEISSIALSEEQNIAYIALWDAPFYSLNAIYLPQMQILAQRATASYTETKAFKYF